MKEGWEYKKLPEISENLDSLRKPVTKKNRTAGIYPYYGASGIVDYVDDYLFDEDLLCISEDGANLLMRTYPIAFPISGKVWVNNHAHVLRFKDIATQKYVEYFFAGFKLDDYITGAAQPKLTQKALNNITIKIPISLSEQQSIVDYLDSAFAKIDAMKANAEKSLNEAKALFQASLKEMLEPKEGWEEKKLKEVGRTQTGTTPSKSVKSFYGGDIPFIRPAELDIDGRGSIEYNSELKLTTEGALKSRTIRANSTLMCCIGSVGKTGYATKDVTCNQQINTITPYEGYNDKFVYYALLAPSFQNEVIKIANSAKATLAIISKGKWEELSIHIPLLSEQHSIVVTLDSLNSKVARLQENFDKISQECDALKQALLREVFEG